MKKIGNEYTLRGKYEPDGGFNLDKPDRLLLCDGRFDTGYKIVDFVVWGVGIDVGQDNDVIGVITTEDLGEIKMDAGENRQIAWCSNRGGTYAEMDSIGRGIVVPDHMIIEDLYFYGFCGDQSTEGVNYLITLQKYDISDSLGALSMVRNRSQA